MAEMETEADRVAEPLDVMDTEMEGIIAEPSALATDPEVEQENNMARGPEAMEMAMEMEMESVNVNMNVTAEGRDL